MQCVKASVAPTVLEISRSWFTCCLLDTTGAKGFSLQQGTASSFVSYKSQT